MCGAGLGNPFRVLQPGSMIPAGYGFRKPPGTVCL